MGCCASRTAAGNDDDAAGIANHPHPYVTAPDHHDNHDNDHADESESSRNITAASPPRPASLSSHTQSHSHSQHPSKGLASTGFLRPLDCNRHCRPPDPFSFPTTTALENPGQRPWTRAKLEKERNDWWDTRDQGSRQIWSAYRKMVELAQRGHMSEAQVLLDAAGCSCPSGKLWHAIYDERGAEYAIRDSRHNFDWVVFDPVGLKEGDEEGDEQGKNQGLEVDGGSENEAPALAKGKGKGKSKAAEDGGGDVLKVRCRLSTTGRDYIIDMRKGDKIGAIMASLSRITGLEPQRHRISYLGRLFAAQEVLPTQGERAWKDGNVLTVLVMEGS